MGKKRNRRKASFRNDYEPRKRKILETTTDPKEAEIALTTLARQLKL